MFRTRARRPRKPRVYRISVETYLTVLATAFALAVAYFLPDSDAQALFVAAAGRGVDVRILVPGKVNDVPATRAGGRSSFGELLAGGVKMFEYEPTMFHPKTMVVDGIFVTVGSTNFDRRSFRLNDEINLTAYDRELGRRFEIFIRDLARSRPYT